MRAFFSRHLWIVLIAGTIANAYILRARSKKYILEKPERAEGYDRIIRGMITAGIMLVIPIAIGMELGRISSPSLFDRDHGVNPVILVSLILWAGLWVIGFRWIFFKGGGDFMVDHPGLVRGDNWSATWIKVFYCVSILGPIGGVVMMYITRDHTR